MDSLVIKFGGSVFRNNKDILDVAEFIKAQQLESPKKLVCVVGALKDKSEHLLDEAISLCSDPVKREVDVLMATGEEETAAKVSIALQSMGLKAVSLTGGQIGIKTTDQYRNARVKGISLERIQQELEIGNIVVVAGFQGIDSKGNVTTFDESIGGSDLTAVLIAGAMNCDCILYKDVEGFYAVDPRVFPRAKKLDIIDYRDAAQLASVSAGVIEPYAIEIAEKFGIKLYLAKSGQSYQEGTLIHKRDESTVEEVVTGIAMKDNIGVVSLKWEGKDDKSSLLFDALLEHEVVVDVTVKEPIDDKTVAVSFSYDMEDAEAITAILSSTDILKDCEIVRREYLASVAINGLGMLQAKGVVSRLVNALLLKKIPFYTISASDVTVAALINSTDAMQTIIALADEFSLVKDTAI